MDLPNALLSLSRDPNLVAFRERGVAIRCTAGLVIERVFIPRPHRWSPGFADLVAMDWVVNTREQLLKKIQDMQQEAGA